MLNKTWNSPFGALINCPDFDPCHLCYGCRNYTSYRVKCEQCRRDNEKDNICKREIHTEKALFMMLKSKDKINL